MTELEQVLRREERYVLKMRRLYELYGYKKYKMGKFEHYDLYQENKPFLQSENIVTFTDAGGTLLALKPDITLSIVKNAPEEFPAPHKVYYCENVYRSTDAVGGIKEIEQVGIECIGEVDVYAQAEVLYLAARSLGEISDQTVIAVSHMGLLTALLDRAGLSGTTRREALRCLGEKNAHELRGICAAQAVPASEAARLEAVLAIHGGFATGLDHLSALLAGVPNSDPARLAAAELASAYAIVEALGCGEQLVLDFSVANDMDYYNGITFAGYVYGIPEHALSGGRYDTLVQKFGKQAGAIGFAIYPDLLERLETGENDPKDVDVLIVYGAADPTEAAYEAARRTALGQTVRVQKEDTGTVRYGERVVIGGETA